jgi:polar amino acid transport system substrate-binding protein
VRTRLALAAAALLLPVAAGAATPAPPPTKTPGELVIGLSMPVAGFQVGAVKGRTVLFAKGFEIELGRALGRTMGVPRVRFVNEALFSTLLRPAGKDWDFALAEITVTPERRKTVDFSTSYLKADQGVLMRKGVPPVKSIAKLRELRICAERATTGALLVVRTIDPIERPVLTLDQSDLAAKLFSGRCDAAVSDAPVLGVMRDQSPERFGLLAGRIATGESYAAAFERGSALRPFVDRALAQLRRNGTLSRLERKWLTADVSKLPVLR